MVNESKGIAQNTIAEPALQILLIDVGGLNEQIKVLLQRCYEMSNNIKNYREPSAEQAGVPKKESTTFYERMNDQIAIMRQNLGLVEEIERGLKEIVGA